MVEVSLEELNAQIEGLAARIEELEKVANSSKAIDHKGVAVIAGEGLEGGGTIYKSRALKFAFESLTRGRIRLSNEIIPLFSPSDGEHQVIQADELVADIVRLSGLPEKIEELREDVRSLAARVELFAFYERLYAAEAEIKVLKEKLDGQEAERQAEAEAQTEAGARLLGEENAG